MGLGRLFSLVRASAVKAHAPDLVTKLRMKSSWQDGPNLGKETLRSPSLAEGATPLVPNPAVIGSIIREGDDGWAVS